MNNLISLFKHDLDNLLIDLHNKKIIKDLDFNNINIDFASKSKQGDISTNIFLVLIKKNLVKKFDMKEYIYNYLINLKYINKVEIANAGFINIFFEKKFLIDKLKNLFQYSDNLKSSQIKKEKINIEFVSANPTGPIHVAHMRGAVLGDVLSSILESVGHHVTREYYINNAGSQITILGKSLFKRYQQLFDIKIELTEGEYPGNYLIDIAKKIKDNDSDKWLKYPNQIEKNNFFESYAVNLIVEDIKEDLKNIDIIFDKFTYESEIVHKKIIDKVFKILNEKNLIYEGVLPKPLGDDDDEWEPRKQLLYKSTNFLDDSDRAFKKENGEWTYFANDAAYHYEKYLRDYDKLINIWGADHIGYVKRMTSIADTFSYKDNYLEIIICQIVRLIKDGNLLKMSKREGNFISLKNILNEVGKDALRYYMISTKNETPMDFDLNKVITKNKDNPVFYCQYAFARASSIIRKSNNIDTSNLSECFDVFNISAISNEEWIIILKLLVWPYVLQQSAQFKQPHRITNYLEDLCGLFHSFWNKGKDNPELRIIDNNSIKNTTSKLIWVEAFRMILRDIFKIIGIEAHENM